MPLAGITLAGVDASDCASAATAVILSEGIARAANLNTTSVALDVASASPCVLTARVSVGTVAAALAAADALNGPALLSHTGSTATQLLLSGVPVLSLSATSQAMAEVAVTVGLSSVGASASLAALAAPSGPVVTALIAANQPHNLTLAPPSPPAPLQPPSPQARPPFLPCRAPGGPTCGPTIGPTCGLTIGPTWVPTICPTCGPTIGPTCGPACRPLRRADALAVLAAVTDRND